MPKKELYLYEDHFCIRDKIYTKEEFCQMYLTENKSIDEMAIILGISYSGVQRIICNFKIHKDKRQAEEIAKKVCLEKYGVEFYTQTKEYTKKYHETCLEKYGTKYATQSEDVKEKTKHTCLEKYGVTTTALLPEVLEKKNKTCLEKYGVVNPTQRNINHFDIYSDKDKFQNYLLSLDKKPLITDLADFFNCSDSVITNRIHELNLESLVDLDPSRSRYEDEIVNFLHEINIDNIILNSRKILNGKEIDIYLPDYNMGIEFNGDYWHSDIFKTDHRGRSVYHQEKSLFAEEKGIFLFHIFEYEWNNPVVQNNIKNRLKTILCLNKTRIPARKCKIIELSKEQKKTFLEDNHIQGNDHSTKQFGLMYNNEIVACMTFVKPRNAKYNWELSRFCNKHEYVVQGGASKLFKHFINMLNKNENVVSYSDITKTKGTLYKTLGFTLCSVNRPNYVWINFLTQDIRTRYQEQAAGELARMHEQGYHMVCDCGTKTWLFTKN